MVSPGESARRRFGPEFWGLLLGPLLLLVTLFWNGAFPADPAHRLLAVLALTVTWWLTEPIPISITALFAVALCYLLRIPQDVAVAALPNGTLIEQTKIDGDALVALLAPFAKPVVFFLLGGMFLGAAMSRQGLDRRFALAALTMPGMGRSPATILFAVGLAVAGISMFISNTAATAMVFPVALQILTLLDGHAAQRAGRGEGAVTRSRFGTALLLMTAYASSVGGIATPIGTTTNVMAMGFFRRPEYFGKNADFFRWMQFGVPLTAVLFVALFLLLWWFARGARLDMELVRADLLRQRKALGPWKRGEVNTCAVFVVALTLWVFPGLLAMVDPERSEQFYRVCPEELVALLIPTALFLLPEGNGSGKGTLHPDDIQRVDWSALLLFGGGLALGSLVEKTKLAANGAALLSPYWDEHVVLQLTLLAVAAGIILSECTSNAAAVMMLIPVVWNLAKQWNVDPLAPLMGLTFGASFGSALPVSTPPNTLVYGSGRIPLRRMIGLGIGFDLVCWLVVSCGVLAAIALGWVPWLGG